MYSPLRHLTGTKIPNNYPTEGPMLKNGHIQNQHTQISDLIL